MSSSFTSTTTFIPTSLLDQLSNPLFRTFLVTGLGGVIAGFILGRAFGGWGGTGKCSGVRGRGGNRYYNSGDGDDDDDESGERADADGSGLRYDYNEECKLVLVVRTDLGMTKGMEHLCMEYIFVVTFI